MPRQNHHRQSLSGAGSNSSGGGGGSGTGGGSGKNNRNGGGVPLTGISALLPPALQLLGAAAAPPRRRLPKNIPILQTPESDTEATIFSSSSSSSSIATTESETARQSGSATDLAVSLPATLGRLGAKVSGPSLPVVRAGATFFSTLHTSVALSASLYPPSNPSSAPSSPYLPPTHRPGLFSSSSILPTSITSLATAGPAAAAVAAAEAAGADNASVSATTSTATMATTAAAPTTLPSLDFVPASNEDEKVAGLKLVADSIAQRRQLASYALITHPYFLGLMGLAFAGVYNWLYKVPGDMLLVMTTCVGVLMAGLVSVRAAVRPYIDLAESINLSWLESADGGGSPEVVVARWGDGDDRRVIGASIFNIEKGSGNNGSGSGNAGGRGGSRKGKKTAVVRAWTTRQRERGKGVGKGLIEETVKLARARGADEVRWQEDNIYSRRVLPAWANYGFEEGLKACRSKFEQYVNEYGGGSSRK